MKRAAAAVSAAVIALVMSAGPAAAANPFAGKSTSGSCTTKYVTVLGIKKVASGWNC